MESFNGVLFILLIAAGIAIFVLINMYRTQKQSISDAENKIKALNAHYEEQAANQKEQTERQISEQKEQTEKQISEQKAFYEKQIDEIEKRHADELSEQEKLFRKKLNDVQSRIEVHKDELRQKDEKELLIDVMLGIEALNNGQKAGFSSMSDDLIGVKTIKDNLFDIGDSILNDISAAHKETITKLGIHGDLTVASILADLFELMSKR